MSISRFAAGSLPVFAVGATRVVKLFPPPNAGEVEHEARVLAAVAGRLPIATPRPLEVGELDGWRTLWMDRLPGRGLDEVWPELDRESQVALVRGAGEAFRALHAVPAPTDALAPDGLAWPAFVAQQMEGCVEHQRARGLDERWLAGLDEFLAASGVRERADAQASLLHTEVMPAHLTVVERAGRLVLAGLLDFEPARVGDPEYELASLAAFWFRGDVGLWAPFLEGYGGLESGWRRRALAHCALHRYSDLARYLGWIPAGPPGDWGALERAWFGALDGK